MCENKNTEQKVSEGPSEDSNESTKKPFAYDVSNNVRECLERNISRLTEPIDMKSLNGLLLRNGLLMGLLVGAALKFGFKVVQSQNFIDAQGAMHITLEPLTETELKVHLVEIGDLDENGLRVLKEIP